VFALMAVLLLYVTNPVAADPLSRSGSGLFDALLDPRVSRPTRAPRRHLIGLWY